MMASLRIGQAEVFRLHPKPALVFDAPREFLVYAPFKGPYGLYLQLDGPFCYPRWVDKWEQATLLSKGKAFAFAQALSEARDFYGRLIHFTCTVFHTKASQ